MKQSLFTLLCFFISWDALPQVKDLPTGKVTLADLEIKSFPQDTSANAVVLDEVGQTHITDDEEIIFEHYVKIKILNKNGFHQADFSIPLRKQDGQAESLLSAKASTYNLNGVSMRETQFDSHNIFTEARSKYLDIKKFTLPEIREGSVIEVLYKTQSPFRFNFHTWEFQSDIPKIHTEYRTVIPGNYIYNITLRGFLKFTKNESDILKDCFRPGGAVSDCARAYYGMDHVPAFKEEEGMTARKNFLSAIYFELSEVRQFNGLINKYTVEWKEVDEQLKQNDDFGKQVRKANSIWEEKIKTVASSAPDELSKAKFVYNLISSWYTWNDNYGMFTDLGVKKAFDTKTGNVADINLSLVGALQALDLKAFPVILSTRTNGLPIEVHPVISSFNYVIASVDIGGIVYLLDATNPWLPFGLIPMRCLNGKGRLMSKESSWIDLKPTQKRKTSTSMDLALMNDGFMVGKIVRTSYGYDALSQRIDILSANDTLEYFKKLQNSWGDIEIVNHKLENLRDPQSQLVENFTVKIPVDKTGGSKTVFFNPFLIDRLKANPFKSEERLYPVDYGAASEEILILSLSYPSDMVIDELPKNAALALQQNGGRYLFSVTPVNNKLSITSFLTLNKPVYNSAEYHNLKELCARMLQIQQSQIVLKKK